MDLQTLLMVIGSVAIVLTLVIGLIYKGHKSWLMTFLQNFCGVFFIFSGWVKAMDPMGTGFKMEQYFGEFESTFADTWFSFLAPLFPFLSNYSIGFSVFMIVFEIALGIMLILGWKSKFTSWAFLLMVGFFTVLTGFTFLTGYVPSGSNFFAFSTWGPYMESNMKVTDCGCFGDFIKLKPKVTFLKDVCLMFPALYFLFRHKDMHELFPKAVRTGIVALVTIGTLIYCLSNFVWDLPGTDFRPFKKGADVKAIKKQEFASMSNVQITGWIFENTNTGQVAPVPIADYTTAAANYPKADGWKVKDQMQSEPEIKPTKISEYEILSVLGDDLTEGLLNDPNPSFMIVSYKMKADSKAATKMVRDSIYTLDTIQVAGTDSTYIQRTLAEVQEKKVDYMDMIWDESYANAFKDIIQPFAGKAQEDNIKVYAVIGGIDEEKAIEMKDDLGLTFDLYNADDILLKTIVRSNPGVLLWKNGKIIDKWHKNKLPSYEEVRNNYLK